jgi:aminoglycoside phosphotransferase (APT) family kinase protein
VSLTDEPRGVRPGEELDGARLGEYLAQHLPGLSGPLAVRQFPAGFSNLTYLLRAGEAELVLRRPPFGTKPKTGHDMAREFRVLSALRERFPYCPRALHYCADESVVGAPFYVMERLRGVILRGVSPGGSMPMGGAGGPESPPASTSGAEFTSAPQTTRAQQTALVDVLAQLHAVDYAAAGLAELGRPEGYVERQVQGWAERYERARTPDSPGFEGTLAWLAAHRPRESGAALIHNDYKLDNVVFDESDPRRLVGVLDWEMATLGDPLMDLGCSLSYWVQADDPDWLRETSLLPTQVPGSLTRREVLARYAAQSGREIADARFYYVFGLFRLAGIAQQIYYRFHHGQTRDARFAALGASVQRLDRAAQAAAEGELL